MIAPLRMASTTPVVNLVMEFERNLALYLGLRIISPAALVSMSAKCRTRLDLLVNLVRHGWLE